MQPSELLKAMFRAAVDATLPSLCVPAHLPPRPKARTIVIGAGNASSAMAKVLVDAGEGLIEGLSSLATAIACQRSGSRWARYPRRLDRG